MEKDKQQIKKEILKAKNISRSSLFQRLAARFGFAISQKSGDKKSSYNTKVQASDIKFIDFNPEIKGVYKTKKAEIDDIERAVLKSALSARTQDYLEQWLDNNMCSYDDIKERQVRINELENLYYNAPFVSSAVAMIAGEVVGSNTDEIFEVVSEDIDFATKTNKLLNDTWNLKKPRLYSIAEDIWKYGESFLGASVNSNGITALHKLRPLQIQERFEFSMEQIDRFNGVGGDSTYLGKNNQTNYKSRKDLFSQYKDWISDDSQEDLFKTWLLGYRGVDDSLIMPWQVVHFRYRIDSSEFFPYGKPPLLPCLSAFSLCQTEMGLNALRKYLSLPLTVYKVKTGNVSASRAFEIVNTVKEDYENSGLLVEGATDGLPSANLKLWTSDDLVTVENVNSGAEASINNPDSLKFFENRVAQCTGIPRSHLDVTAENFQTSGVALSQLHMPFQRQVESVRATITETIVDVINLHYSINGISVPEYSLVMKTVSKSSTENMSQSLQIVDSVFEKVCLMLGVESAAELPDEIKKDILTKYSPISDDEIDSWINIYDTSPKKEVAPEAEGEGLDFGAPRGAERGFSPPMPGGLNLGGADLESEEPSGNELPERRRIRAKSKKNLSEIIKRYKNIEKRTLLLEFSKKLGNFNCAFGKVYNGNKVYDSSISDVIRFLNDKSFNKKGKKHLKN